MTYGWILVQDFASKAIVAGRIAKKTQYFNITKTDSKYNPGM